MKYIVSVIYMFIVAYLVKFIEEALKNNNK